MATPPGHIDLREEMLDLGTLPCALRALTVTTVLIIVGGVLLLLTRDLPGEFVSLGKMRGGEARISLALFCYLYLMLLASWAFLMAGALQMRWWAGLPVLALVTVTHWIFLDLGAVSLGTFALGGLWLYSLLRWSFWRRAGVWQDIAVIGLLLGLVYGWVVLSAVAEAYNTSGAAAVSNSLLLGSEITIIVFLMLPLLFLAGVDLAELSGQIGAWTVATVAGRQPSRTALGAAIVVTAALWAAYRLQAGARFGFGTLAALAAFAVATGVSWAFRRHASRPHEPSFALLLAMASLLFIVPALLVMFTWVGVLPDAWMRGFRIETTWALAGPVAVLAALLLLLRARKRGMPLPESGLFMLIYGLWVSATIGAGGRLVVSIAQMDLGVSVTAVVSVLLLWRIRAGAAAYRFVAEVLVGMIAISGILTLYSRDMAVAEIYLLFQIALVLGAAAIGTVRAFRAAGDAAGRRHRWGLAAVSAGLLALVLVMIGEMVGIVPTRWALPPDILTLIVLIAALLWDILLSGGRFTNGDTPALPRAARVALYLGYVLLATSLLLWSSGQKGAEPFIDDATLTLLGLMTLGIPVFLFVSAASGSRLWPRRQAALSLDSGTITADMAAGGDA